MRTISKIVLACLIIQFLTLAMAGILLDRRDINTLPTISPKAVDMGDGNSGRMVEGPYSLIPVRRLPNKDNKITFKGMTFNGRITFTVDIDANSKKATLSRNDPGYETPHGHIPDGLEFMWQLGSNESNDPYLKTRRNDWLRNLETDHEGVHQFSDKTDLNSILIYAFQIKAW